MINTGKVITTKGSWRKRDRSRLEKEFPLNYLTQYLLSKAKAEQYYQELTKVIWVETNLFQYPVLHYLLFYNHW